MFAAAAARIARSALARPAIQLTLGAGVLLIPALINGTPYLFPDTGGYAQAGVRAIQALAGHPHTVPELADSYLATRSVFYGVLYSPIAHAGTIWAVAAAKALAVAFTLRLMARAIFPTDSQRIYPILILALTCLSTLPFFVAFMTPDIFAGVALALAALLALYPDSMSVRERGWAWTLLVAALTFHASHAMTALLIIPMLIAAQFARARQAGLRAARLAGSALACALALMTVSAGVNALSPVPQRTPPFLTARLLADGPGRVWLRQTCARDQTVYALCAFKDQALDSDENILWSPVRGVGVFTVLGIKGRMALIDEQPRFVRDVVLHYPVETVGAAWGNFTKQIGAFDLRDDYVFDPGKWLGYEPDFYMRLLLERAGCTDPSCGARAPIGALNIAHAGAVVLALIALAWCWTARRTRPQNSHDVRFWLLTGVVIAGILINAALCGALAGPYARYQARVIWLVPMLAILAEGRFSSLRGLLKLGFANLARHSPPMLR